MNYINLHTHDYFSTLDGLSSPAEYMVRAKELGMTHLAETNHGTLAGHREFQVAAKNAGIIPILGIEGYVSPTDRFDRRSAAKRQDGTSVYNHITILAQNEVGLKTLGRLSEKAWTEGFYFKPRMDTELIFEDNEGIIVLSGCMSGLIAKAIERGDNFHAKRVAENYKNVLGDRFYIEVMSTNPPELNHALLEIADSVGIPPVMTTDCHYANKDDLWLEEAVLILSTSPKPNYDFDMSKSQKMDVLERYNYLYPERTMTFQEIEVYLRDYETEVTAFQKQGITRTDIYENTFRIADSVGEYPFHENLDLLPYPKNGDPITLLRDRVEDGLKKRGVASNPEYRERVEEELDVINGLGFARYFIILENSVSKAKSRGIRVGPGRGSGVGSLVNYVLGVTDVDPLKYGLLFFRFLDPSRPDWPDVDVDYMDRRRGEVKELLVREYTHGASIATFTRFGGKISIKDAARVFRVPIAEVNRALKNNDPPSEDVFFEYFEASAQGKEFIRKYPEVLKLAKELYGRIRGGGMHAGGVVLSSRPISEFAPMETAKDPNDPNGPRIPMIGYDMNDAADIGLIKLDVLGLKALTIIDDALVSIKQRHGIDIDLNALDFADGNVYAMLSRGHTRGVFQCEAVPYTNLIMKMGGVSSFDELVASNALVRPGAMNTIGAEYIMRKNGKSPVEYAHQDVKWFTEDTYGEVLYQEQVMLMMTELAGMSMTDANKVRKIIGKKRDVSEFEQFKDQFVSGASKKVRASVAKKLWKDFEAHAGYSFNKSHAVAYSMISYWTAWLKYHYPLEFMAASLRNETDPDAFTDSLIEAKRLELRVLLPNVNESGLYVQIEGDSIRLGLTTIKYISDNVGERIIAHRPYKSFAHLKELAAVKGSGINKRAIDAMDLIGAATFPDNPKRGNERDYFYEYLKIPAFETKSLDPKIGYKIRTFDEYEETGVFPVLGMVRKIKRGTGWARVEMVDETGSAGIFADQNIPLESGQMYVALVADNRIVRYMTLEEVTERTSGAFTDYLYDECGEIPEDHFKVIAFRSYVTKAGKKMAYTVLLDHLGQLYHMMAFPQMYMQAFAHCRDGAIINAVVEELKDGGYCIKEFKVDK